MSVRPLQPDRQLSLFFFFFNDTATTEIYTLSLHDALPICILETCHRPVESKVNWIYAGGAIAGLPRGGGPSRPDRKSTRLNSSHDQISYAVFCLKKKKKASDIHIYWDSDPQSVVFDAADTN